MKEKTIESVPSPYTPRQMRGFMATDLDRARQIIVEAYKANGAVFIKTAAAFSVANTTFRRWIQELDLTETLRLIESDAVARGIKPPNGASGGRPRKEPGSPPASYKKHPKTPEEKADYKAATGKRYYDRRAAERKSVKAVKRFAKKVNKLAKA